MLIFGSYIEQQVTPNQRSTFAPRTAEEAKSSGSSSISYNSLWFVSVFVFCFLNPFGTLFRRQQISIFVTSKVECDVASAQRCEYHHDARVSYGSFRCSY